MTIESTSRPAPEPSNPINSAMCRVSIGLPVYNGEVYLRETIHSLLNQTFRDFELIVSDNASTDNTRAICEDEASRDARIFYYRHERNLGAAPNFNFTVSVSRGQYFKWAAHDDLYEPDFLRECVRILDNHPHHVLCFSNTKLIDERGRTIGNYDLPKKASTSSLRDRFLWNANSNHIVMEIFGLIRVSALRETPLIRSFVGADRVLLAQLSLMGPFAVSPRRLFLHREHNARSALAHRDSATYTTWFDTRKRGTWTAPTWKRMLCNFCIVVASEHAIRIKLLLLFDALRAAKWNQEKLVNELLSFGRRISSSLSNRR